MVRAKKHLGQHFLKDDNIAFKIAAQLSGEGYEKVLEIGPGTGKLTRHLLHRNFDLYTVEVDRESIEYLGTHFPKLNGRVIDENFLHMDLEQFAQGNAFAVTGNLPYNISSQILFKVLDNKHLIPEFVGMFQREVAQRIAAHEGSKTYGILSVLIQLNYHVEYLFEVPPQVFLPPPKVHSAVIRLKRKEAPEQAYDEQLLRKIVKQAFGLRRKTLKNALKSFRIPDKLQEDNIFAKRPEQLPPQDFIRLTNMLERK